MTPSHDAPDTGPTSFDDGPAPQTLGLSRREMRAAERARALALGIDEADDAPVEQPAPDEPSAESEGPAEPASAAADAPAAAASPEEAERAAEPTPPAPAHAPAASGVGPETSAILLSGGVLTRRQLRAIREAEEAARQQRGSEHAEAEEAPARVEDAADAPSAPSLEQDVAPGGDAPAAEPAEQPVEDAQPVDDAPPSTGTSVPPYARYGSGSRATPRPRAPYGSAYRRPAGTGMTASDETPEVAERIEQDPVPAAVEAPAVEAPAVEAPAVEAETMVETKAEAEAESTTGTPTAESPAAEGRSGELASAATPSAWPFAPIVPSSDSADRDVDTSGEQPTVPPLAAHIPSRDEDPRPAPSLAPAAWATGSGAVPTLEPAFGTRASAAAEDLDGVDVGDRVPDAAVAADVADVRAPFTPPTGHWSVQDQVDEDQPHTGNHFILPTVPHAGDMQQALNSTGEIIITGSIDLPRSLGSMGTHPDRFDTADMDRILEQGDDHDHAPGASDSEPVRASRAVSTHTSTRAVVQPPPRKRFTAPVVAAVTAGGVAVIGAGLVVVAFMTNVF